MKWTCVMISSSLAISAIGHLFYNPGTSEVDTCYSWLSTPGAQRSYAALEEAKCYRKAAVIRCPLKRLPFRNPSLLPAQVFLFIQRKDR